MDSKGFFGFAIIIILAGLFQSKILGLSDGFIVFDTIVFLVILIVAGISEKKDGE
tara:strand:+ start:203 stop:367 length:165 start_codon:yes stop_codon:yes gene_type:complete